MRQPAIADLIVKGGTIITMDPAAPELENHSLAVKDGKIAAIYPSSETFWSAPEILDASDCLLIPGLINTHSHLPMTYFRGLADDLPLDIWLREYIWPMEAKILNAQVIRDATLHGACEMLKNGISMSHDMYFNMPAIADACTEAGLRVIIGEAVIDARVSDGSLPGTQIRELRQRYKDNPLVDFDLPPHSIYSCSRSTLEKCIQAARELDMLLHIHLSETEAEVQNCLKEQGKRPVHYLNELGMLDQRVLLAHAIWVDASEIEVLAAKGVSIASCTDSNLKLSSGILPLKSYLDQGVNVSLATDGVASNNDLDLLSELGNTARLHKAINRDPAFLPAKEALKLVTINAAKALGVEHLRGSLEVGKDADICVMELNDLQSQPLYNSYSHLVYALGSRHVRDMVVAGRVVLRNGQLTQADETELVATAKAYGLRIKAELGQ
ncbi:MAG TPA: amidohydrolase family protein [Candidatus Cloacimonadota bacterium]|nr:amidohydrolase family protein [Candidatus Cloacimonadota bacterium]